MVKVLVGKRQGPSFPGFWAEFDGEKVSSYEDTRSVADESNPANPVYDLLPSPESSGAAEPRRDFPAPWQKDKVVAEHPMFVKDLEDYLDVSPVDPPLPGGI